MKTAKILLLILAALQIGPVQAGEKNKYVTILYMTWHDYFLRGQTYLQPNCPPWGPYSSFHWWGTPAYTTPINYRFMNNYDPNSPNSPLIDYHADLLYQAGIDFITVDLSNGSQTDIVNGAKALCMRYGQRSLSNTPRVAFFVYDAATAQVVKDTFYTGAYPPGIFFNYAGKPLIMVTPTGTSVPIPTGGVWTNFTARRMWGLSNDGFDWSFKENTPPATLPFKNYLWPEEMSVAAACQQTYMTTPQGRKGRNGGAYFAEQWGYVNSNQPTFTFVTSWNEWGAQNLGNTSTPIFTDSYLTEYNADLEPMSGGHTDAYYNLLRNYITQFKRNTPNLAVRDATTGTWYIKYYYGSAYRNLEASNYSFSFNWAAGANYQSFTGDFNKDGLGDIGLRDTTSGTWYFAERLNAAYAFANNNNFYWAAGANYQPYIGDFNGDSITDMGMRDSSNGIWFFRQASSPYVYPTQYQYQWTTGSNYEPMLADFKGDGRLDLALRNKTTGVITFATGNVTPYTFTVQSATFPWAAGTNYQAFAGDFDRDGFGDIALRDSNTGKLYLANGNGSWGFNNWDNIQFQTGPNYEAHLSQ